MVSKSSSNAIQVQGTNDHSTVSKLSMIEKYYFDDPFLKFFVKKNKIPKRSSLINRGYYIRSKVVRSVVNDFLQEIPGEKQIISLGAGFDTTYFCMQQNHIKTDWQYIEIDYPDVIRRKLNLAKFHALFGESVQEQMMDQTQIYRCKNYLAFGFDLRSAGGGLTKLLTKNGIDLSKKTLFLSEVVLTYLTGSQSTKILNWISFNFPNAMTLIFEQMLPHDGFGKVMCRHFESIGSPLLSITAIPTLQCQIERHGKAGFNLCSHTDLYSYFRNLPKEERIRIEKLEMFDEYEGWHQMCLHYFALSSTNSSLIDLRSFCSQCFKQEKYNYDGDTAKVDSSCLVDRSAESVKMFGHCMCPYDKNTKVLTVGGFGIHKSNHERLNRAFSVDLSTNQVLACNDVEFKETLFSSMVKYCKPDGTNVFVVFGGRAAPNRASDRIYFIEIDKNNSGELLLNVKQGVHRPGGGLPPGRWRHSSSVCSTEDDLSSAQMVVVGGRDEARVFSDCWKMDLSNQNWSKLNLLSDAKVDFTSRHSHSSTWWEATRKLVITGGLSEESCPFNDVLLLDTTSGKFERFKTLVPLPPRYSHTSHILRDQLLFLVGGVAFPDYPQHISSHLATFDHIAIVDLDASSWTRVIFPATIDNHPFCVHSHTSLIEDTEKGVQLTIIGGGSNCFSFGTALTNTPVRFLLNHFKSN